VGGPAGAGLRGALTAAERQADLWRQIAEYHEEIIARFLEGHPEVHAAARKAGLLPEALPPPDRNGTAGGGDDGNGVLE
jgi:hypothetical protein